MLYIYIYLRADHNFPDEIIYVEKRNKESCFHKIKDVTIKCLVNLQLVNLHYKDIENLVYNKHAI